MNVRVRSLPLTEIPSDDDDEEAEFAVCCAEAQLRLPVATLAAAGGGVGLTGVTGDVPPPEEPPPPDALPPPDEDVLEAEVALEFDVPPDDPPEHPVISRAEAIAAADAIRIVIRRAALQSK